MHYTETWLELWKVDMLVRNLGGLDAKICEVQTIGGVRLLIELDEQQLAYARSLWTDLE